MRDLNGLLSMFALKKDGSTDEHKENRRELRAVKRAGKKGAAAFRVAP
jgi:hypothetical protein